MQVAMIYLLGDGTGDISMSNLTKVQKRRSKTMPRSILSFLASIVAFSIIAVVLPLFSWGALALGILLTGAHELCQRTTAKHDSPLALLGSVIAYSIALYLAAFYAPAAAALGAIYGALGLSGSFSGLLLTSLALSLLDKGFYSQVKALTDKAVTQVIPSKP